MRNSLVFAGMATAVVAVAACDILTPYEEVCAGVGYDAVQVDIRDVHGNPQAFGAVVTLIDGSYVERDSSIYDALSVRGAQERGGRTYDIVVSKPHYLDKRINKVKAPGGGCVHANDHATVTVPVVLTLATDAPAVRSLNVLPRRKIIDRGPYGGTATFVPYLDVNPGISKSVIWRVGGDTASASFDPATATFQYRCLPTSGLIIVTALSSVDSTVIGRSELAVQGHPAAPTDPPCS